MASVFNKKLTPACKYCQHSKALSFGSDFLCLYKGITDENNSCRKYKYDPLKREPQKQRINTNYSEKDFEI